MFRAGLILLLLLLCPAGLWAAEGSLTVSNPGQDSISLPPQETGSGLREIVFNVAGQEVSVKNGGVLALHPDTPFRVLSIHSDNWFQFNLQAKLAGQPGVDLVEQTRTLAGLLGEDIYQKEFVDIVVLRQGSPLGGVRIMVRWLPIDWLRKAQTGQSLEEQVFYLHKAYELAPDNRLLALNLLDGLRRLGRLQQALAVLRDYAGLNNDAQALRQQGYLYQALDRLNEAMESFKAALALNPGDWDITLALLELYESTGKWPEAAGLLEELVEKSEGAGRQEALPGEEPLTFSLRLARAYSHIPEKMETSLAVYEKYLQTVQADPLLWLEVAQLYERAGQSESGLRARRQALSMAPGSRDMIMQLQNALQREGKYDEAISVLWQGLADLPEDEALWLELIRLYGELKDKEGLIGAYGQYTVLHPQNYELRYYLAMMLEDSGRLAEAIQRMEEALQLRQDYPDYLLALARMKNQAGQVDEALEAAARLLGKEPVSVKIWQELYALFAQSRAGDLALLLEQSLGDPRAPATLYEMRAVLALDQGQAPVAARTLAAAAQKFPDDVRMLYLLGGIYEGLGQDAQALPVYENILRLQPGYEDVGQRYLQVKLRLLDKR